VCSHIYTLTCIDCNEETDMVWITCSQYKSGCRGLICVLCGEIDEKTFGSTV
jgi:hypothetical protein